MQCITLCCNATGGLNCNGFDNNSDVDLYKDRYKWFLDFLYYLLFVANLIVFWLVLPKDQSVQISLLHSAKLSKLPFIFFGLVEAGAMVYYIYRIIKLYKTNTNDPDNKKWLKQEVTISICTSFACFCYFLAYLSQNSNIVDMFGETLTNTCMPTFFILGMAFYLIREIIIACWIQDHWMNINFAKAGCMLSLGLCSSLGLFGLFNISTPGLCIAGAAASSVVWPVTILLVAILIVLSIYEASTSKNNVPNFQEHPTDSSRDNNDSRYQPLGGESRLSVTPRCSSTIQKLSWFSHAQHQNIPPAGGNADNNAKHDTSEVVTPSVRMGFSP